MASSERYLCACPQIKGNDLTKSRNKFLATPSWCLHFVFPDQFVFHLSLQHVHTKKTNIKEVKRNKKINKKNRAPLTAVLQLEMDIKNRADEQQCQRLELNERESKMELQERTQSFISGFQGRG